MVLVLVLPTSHQRLYANDPFACTRRQSDASVGSSPRGKPRFTVSFAPIDD